MTLDLIRDHTHALTVAWTCKDCPHKGTPGTIDRPQSSHPGLWYLLAAQTEPVHMDANDGSNHRKVSGSPMPGDPAVTAWLMDVHAGVRSLEETLRWAAYARVVPRGGSDVNTVRALRDIPDLAGSLHAMHTDPVVKHLLNCAESDLASWVRRARLLLGVDQRPVRLPKVACPYLYDDGQVCGSFTLRQMPSDGRIVCLVCRTVWDSADWLGLVVEAS